jgi:hypothetical protein
LIAQSNRSLGAPCATLEHGSPRSAQPAIIFGCHGPERPEPISYHNRPRSMEEIKAVMQRPPVAGSRPWTANYHGRDQSLRSDGSSTIVSLGDRHQVTVRKKLHVQSYVLTSYASGVAGLMIRRRRNRSCSFVEDYSIRSRYSGVGSFAGKL